MIVIAIMVVPVIMVVIVVALMMTVVMKKLNDRLPLSARLDSNKKTKERLQRKVAV